jgi:pterin-4a-carbinolamine dehydratase
MVWPFSKKAPETAPEAVTPVRTADEVQVQPAPSASPAHTSAPLTEPENKEPAVFISYRRTNALIVEHIHEKYCAEYRPDSIFLDRQDIEPGAHFPDRLRRAVTGADVVLVVMGRDWISVQNERTFSRRLDEADDWVRQEVEIALNGKGVVVPVLVDGAKVPLPEQLPASLRPLIERNCVTLSMEHFGDDVKKLVGKVAEQLGETRIKGLRHGKEGPYAEAAAIKPVALSDAELRAVLQHLPQWRLVETDITDDPRLPHGYRRIELVRDFLFESFTDAIAFMSRAAAPIDAFGHHPRWQNTFRTVTVAYSTWDIGHRPSDRDNKSAQMLERLYREFMESRSAKD